MNVYKARYLQRMIVKNNVVNVVWQGMSIINNVPMYHVVIGDEKRNVFTVENFVMSRSAYRIPELLMKEIISGYLKGCMVSVVVISGTVGMMISIPFE